MPRSIEDVARLVEISPSHLTRQFDAVFGVTPHQFRIQSRLERARELLAAGEHSVTDVCMEVGFSSLGSFSGLFARRVGVAPSLYQRRVRSLIAVPARPHLDVVPGCLGAIGRLPPSAFRSFREA